MTSSPTICVFEDERYQAFLPITYTRPVFDLLCGMSTAFDKVRSAYPGSDHRQICRPYLMRTANSHDKPSLLGVRSGQVFPLKVLFINGRTLAPDDLAEIIPTEGEDRLYVSGDDLVAARLSGPRLTMAVKWLAEQDSRSVMASFAPEIPVERVEITPIKYLWELIHRNGAEIEADFHRLPRSGGQGTVHPAAAIYEPDNVWVAPSAEVMAGVVIDARSGPIVIDEGARVDPFSLIQGPAYIGPHSRIVTGRIREFTSIGPYCRIGGEVEACIFQGYSNKYHDGFTGHSFFGEWVNLGALTTTSDLKNTYGTIRVDMTGDQIDTGLTKLGSIVGDHVKLGIGVLLNSGTTIGTGCNLFGGGMLPKVIPCFIWGGGGQFQEYDFDRMLRTAQIAMSRRQVEQTEAHVDLLRYVFEVTAPLRRSGQI